MDGKGTGGHERFPDHDKSDKSKHSESPKDKTSRFNPSESTSELNKSNKSTDTHNPTADPFGREWRERQWTIASGHLIEQRFRGTQQLKDQISETETGDRSNETQTVNSTPEQKTIQARVAESAYRLAETHIKNLGRFW